MKRLVLPLLLFLLPVAAPAAAVPAMPTLPAVTLTSLAGTTVSLDDLGTAANVVLVLVRKGESAGERLLAFLEGLDGLPPERLAIVVGGADGAIVSAIAGRHSGVAASWYPDPDGEVAKELQLRATPVTIGARNGIVVWKVIGLHDEETMRKTLLGWGTR